MIALLKKVRIENDSLGGTITCIIKNLAPGIGEPIYNKLNAALAYAMFSINAVKGVEIGNGFDACALKGSENNDAFEFANNKVRTSTNRSGGIQGGISNGEDIFFNVGFKPVSSISKTQQTITNRNEMVSINIAGRHDICFVPRAVPVVEAMTAITILDFVFLQNSKKIR
jgi:chorismate synthase